MFGGRPPPTGQATDSSFVVSTRRRRFDAGVLDVRQGELTKYGGKRPAQTALSACEYRFLVRPAGRTVRLRRRPRPGLLGGNWERFPRLASGLVARGLRALRSALGRQGNSARCGERPGTLPLDPAAFEKAGETFVWRSFRRVFFDFSRSETQFRAKFFLVPFSFKKKERSFCLLFLSRKSRSAPASREMMVFGKNAQFG